MTPALKFYWPGPCILVISKIFRCRFTYKIRYKYAENIAPPDFGESVNPISTRKGKLYPPYYYWHSEIFRLSYGPDMYANENFPTINKYFPKIIT